MALFLGFAKRKAESFQDEASQRAVLAHYPSALLDTFMAATMTATLTTYSLFATSPDEAVIRTFARAINAILASSSAFGFRLSIASSCVL